MKMNRLAFGLACLVLGAGCQKKTPAVAADPGPDAEPIVDLLHTIDTTVAVSSKVDNPHDYPEQLVDGKAETAWNSKTGDLTGFIAFRVPAAARVVRVEVTPGFDKKSAKGDLFTMNHRIRRVRLSRAGQVLKEVALDVDAPGGDFVLDVLETVPGTQTSWKELTVSEFRVWGRAGGSPPNPRRIPRMAIGSLDGVAPPKTFPKTDPPRGPFASIDELCAAHDKVMYPLLKAKLGEDALGGRTWTCTTKHTSMSNFTPDAFKHAPFKNAQLLRVDDLEAWHQTVALETDKGWYRTDVRAGSHDHMDPGCLRTGASAFEDVQFVKTQTGNDVALIRLIEREVSWGQLDESQSGADSIELGFACRIDASGAPSCEGPKTLATAHETLPARFDPGNDRFAAINAGAIPWQGRKKAALGPAGDFRVE